MSGGAGSWNKTGSDSCFQEGCERPSNVSATHSSSCRASSPVLPGCFSALRACLCLRNCLILPVLAVKYIWGGCWGGSRGLLPPGMAAERWGCAGAGGGAGKQHLFPG